MKEQRPQGCNVPLNIIFHFQCAFITIILGEKMSSNAEQVFWNLILESLFYKINLGYSIKPQVII